MKKFLFITSVFFLLLISSPEVLAGNINIPFGHDTVEHLPSVGLTETVVNGQLVSEGEGVEGFRKIVNILLSSMSFMLRAIALFILFAAGFVLVSAQSSVSEQAEKQKMNVLYVLVGLVVFGLASDFVYRYFFVAEGEYIFDEATAVLVASSLAQRIKQLLNLFLSFSGAGAILTLVISGMRGLLNPGNDEVIEQQKKILGYTAVGIIIIGLADTLVNQIVFPSGGYDGVNVSALEVQLRGLSNYLLGFLGVIAFVTFVIAGVVMVINFGNDDLVSKAKAAMKNVFIGCIVAFSAYTIVATIIRTFLAA